MTVAGIITALQSASLAYDQARALYLSAKDSLSSQDQAEVQARLDALQKKNDQLYEDVIHKLRQAESR